MEKETSRESNAREDGGENDDEDEDYDDDMRKEQVMLGFIDEVGGEGEDEGEGEAFPPLFSTMDWLSWDGGKVGGKPLWLNRKDLPSEETVRCGVCNELMKFLLQVYCPLDGVDAAFHRALYVVCCRNKACVENHCVSSKSVKVFRCQLPRSNEFYPYESSTDSTNVEELPNWSTFPKLCRVCGFKATKVCSRCGNANYCSKEHQKLDFAGHKNFCGNYSNHNEEKINSKRSPELTNDSDENYALKLLTFPEYEIYVEPEEFSTKGSQEMKSEGDFKDLVSDWEEAAAAQEDDEVNEGTDDDEDEGDDKGVYEKKDEDLTQKDYSEALGNESPDPLYRKFFNRIRTGGPNQILRYARWDGHQPLPVNSFGTATAEDIPRCENCGGERQFEFQIMPQLLHFLRVDELTLLDPNSIPDVPSKSSTDLNFYNLMGQDIDWGSLDIWTCTGSCNNNPIDATVNRIDGAYMEEFCWRQPSPSLNQSPGHEMGD